MALPTEYPEPKYLTQERLEEVYQATITLWLEGFLSDRTYHKIVSELQDVIVED